MYAARDCLPRRKVKSAAFVFTQILLGKCKTIFSPPSFRLNNMTDWPCLATSLRKEKTEFQIVEVTGNDRTRFPKKVIHRKQKNLLRIMTACVPKRRGIFLKISLAPWDLVFQTPPS